MPSFAAHDGTKLAYRLIGEGAPVVCLPGGPMQDSAYLGDLGGLSERVQLVLADTRGTGRSAAPEDATSYRCDRLVDDVEALREHLGLDRLNLLGHSAGANVALLYAARHPERVDTLVLVTPSSFVAGITATVAARRDVVRLRAGEPWFGPASAAFERINTGQATDGDVPALAPFRYGRWDTEAQAHHALGDEQRNDEAAAMFFADGALDADTTRAALAGLGAPVLLLAGEVDVNSPPSVVAELAEVFRDVTLHTLPGGGHFPWLDDRSWFTEAVAGFVE